MHHDIHQQLMDILNRLPVTGTMEGRDVLLEGIPRHLTAPFTRSPMNRYVDLGKLLEQLEQLGQLEANGARPLLTFLKNAHRSVTGTELGRTLQTCIEQLEREPQKDLALFSPYDLLLPEIPETLIFGGSDERLPSAFFEGAMRVQQSVVRLRVPRFFHGMKDKGAGFGTGWLVTPQLLLTNHHVIAARLPKEPAPTDADLQIQAEQAISWFDYLGDEGAQKTCECRELVHENARLDYALVRLESLPVLENRQPLSIMPYQQLHKADRLNIVQHPGGGPMRYAIRNNFYVGKGDSPDFIRYLTDTEGGASGAPVFDDDWLVVAIHRAARKIQPQSYRGETIKYHNEGIEIHAILADLPPALRQEIHEAQGWKNQTSSP